MSIRSGHTTERRPLEVYNGFRIIKVTEIEYDRSGYYPYPKGREIHFDFCKEGNEKRPSQHYSVWAKGIKDCKECIDKFINDDSTFFTDEEREKYVYRPNQKCKWSYGYNSLMRLMKQHQKADKRMKILIEDRLTDANFHTACGILSKGDYVGFEKYVTSNFKFREKFEILTETEAKRIKDPKQFEEGLAKVIEEYLANQGVKSTTAKVTFIQEW